MTITTISIKPETKTRLTDYKMGDQSFDDVLNFLMDNVSLEDISKEHLRKHFERLKDFDGISKDEFKKQALKRKKGS